MKYILFCSFVILVSFSVIHVQDVPDYKWKEVVKPGNGSFPDKWKPGQWPMGMVPVIAFENRLWMIGQKNSWSSENGMDWNVHSKTDWGERHGTSIVFFKNKLWFMGGMRSWDDFRNDIWSSADGIRWIRSDEKSPWQPRIRHKVVVFKNKLWLIGGSLSSGRADELPAKSVNDVWSSQDGVNWVQELAAAPWPGRHDAQVIVYKEKIWLMGGSDKIGGDGKRDVWSSPDGKNWKLITNKAPWQERTGNGLAVFNNLMWVFGGISKNDVWFSENGSEWNQLNEHAPWSTRCTDYCVSYKNKLWIFSGKTGREDSWAGDIWTLEYQP